MRIWQNRLMLRTGPVPLVLLASALLAFAGCGTRKDVERIETKALVSGKIQTEDGSSDRIYVFLYEVTPDGPQVRAIDSISAITPAYAFVVDPGKAYSVIAFHDRSDDEAWQPGEAAAILGDPVAFSFAPGERRIGQDIVLRPVQVLPPGYAPDRLEIPEDAHRGIQFHIGEVRALDDSEFAPDIGSEGMWRPLETLERHGGGVYFVEPYDPEKIPILFVHGMGGTPRDFETLLAGLDHGRFQAWFFSYPSGFRLERVANVLRLLMTETKKKYPFDDLFVVAHSMGGLVCRAALLAALDAGEAKSVRLFVTFATPWEGHPSAATGIKWMPNSAVPSWFDMTPESEFLVSLRRPLEHDGRVIPHYVFFGFDRTRGGLGDTSSDGTVPLSSQLPEWIQDQAVKYWGYNDDHVGILDDEKSLRRFYRLLGEQADATRPTNP